MDLRAIANSVTQTVNNNEVVTILLSDGYTMGAGARQVPAYKPPIIAPAQVQALDGVDLKQLDGLNIQGTMRAIYLFGEVAGVIRPNQTGGDIIQRGDSNWLVVKVLESWSDWTKAAIVLQGS